MVFPEAWPVAISRGDFTAAAGWFCFSFDCFSLDCATATSDKHANPNTRILLFIFSLLCAGKRTTLALSVRAPDKLSPFRLRDVGRLRRAPQVTEVLAGRVVRAPSPAKIPSMQPRASPLVRFRKGATFGSEAKKKSFAREDRRGHRSEIRRKRTRLHADLAKIKR